MEKEIVYLSNNKSIFLIEEISNRNDYELIGKKKKNLMFVELV